MNRNKNLPIFGPRYPISSYSANPVYQKGEGLSNIFLNIVRRVIPFAKETIKKIASSDITKQAVKELSKQGGEALKNIAADVVSGKNPTQTAKESLVKAQNDISNIIRQKEPKKRKLENIDKARLPKRKRKSYQTLRKDYNIFHGH